MSRLALDDDARLLFFLHHSHGTGVSYNVVTITGIRDGSAWERLGRRCHSGDLSDWTAELDDLRHDVSAKLLVPLPWSPMQCLEWNEVPTDGRAHELTLFMEDTVWPYEGGLERYIAAAGSHYAVEMREARESGRAILAIEASFRTAFGSHRRREVVLWQRVVQPKALVPLITREVPERYKQPGMWMHDALEVRDRWESKLLRSADWSPLF